MPRPVLVLRHARKSALLSAAVVASAALAAGAPAENGPQPLGRVVAVAMTERAMDRRAEYHPTYARELGHRMARSFGWRSKRQWTCLSRLWANESRWRVHADNPSNSAYGIPQALPGRKMRSAGGGWRRNAQTQIRWGLRYVHRRYGSPCGAMRHEEWHGWY